VVIGFHGFSGGNDQSRVKNSGIEDLALICPWRGLLNVYCKYDRFLEYWSNGVMEKPICANLSSRKTPAKHESLRIFLAAARINTPILLVVYYGRANCL
jgi:hypothetical protein